MKIRLAVLLILVLLSGNCFGQYIPFTPGPVQDSAWITSEFNKRLNGVPFLEQYPVTRQVYYSADNILRIGVINLHTILQVNHNGKIIETVLDDDHGLRGKKITGGFIARSGKPVYIVVAIDSTNTATGAGPLYEWIIERRSKDERQVYRTLLASAFRLEGDEIMNVDFEMAGPTEDYYRREDTYVYIMHGMYTLELPFFMDDTGICHTSFIYDPGKNELGYSAMATTLIERADTIITRAYTGTFILTDSGFVQTDDFISYCPTLETYLDTFINKTIKLGGHRIRNVSTRGFEENGFGMFLVENHYFDIGKSKLQSRFLLAEITEEESTATGDHSKDAAVFRLQKDGSLLAMTKHFYTPYRNGSCGSCWYEDYSVLRIAGDSVIGMLELSFNMGDWRFRADLTGCAQQAETYFNLDLFDEDEKPGFDELDYSLKWLDASTLRIRISNYITGFVNDKETRELESYRDYLFSFNSKNRFCTSVVTGKRIKVQVQKKKK